MGHVIFRRLLGRTLHVLAIARTLRRQAMDAFLDIDNLRHPAVRLLEHQRLGLRGRHVAQFADQLDRLRLGLVPGLVEVLVEAHADPGFRCLDAREIERLALDHLDRDVELLVGGLERGEVDLAVALRRVRIAGPQQRAPHEHRHVEGRAGHEIADVHIAGEFAGRNGAVLTRLLARDAERTGERPDRNPDARQELGDHAIEIEIDVLDLAVLIFLRKLAEHAGHVEIGPISARHDLVEPHLEHVAGLGAVDVDRTGHCVRTAPREVGAQLLDLLDRHAGKDLVVRMHHRLHDDGVAGIDLQHRRLRIVEPAPLRGLERRRQDMDFAFDLGRGHDGLRPSSVRDEETRAGKQRGHDPVSDAHDHPSL